jgi:hypothetical protein
MSTDFIIVCDKCQLAVNCGTGYSSGSWGTHDDPGVIQRFVSAHWGCAPTLGVRILEPQFLASVSTMREFRPLCLAGIGYELKKGTRVVIANSYETQYVQVLKWTIDDGSGRYRYTLGDLDQYPNWVGDYDQAEIFFEKERTLGKI